MAAIKQSNPKNLSEFLGDSFSLPSEYDVAIKHAVMDSRKIKEGDLFVSINGEYIDVAIQAGAAAVIWDANNIDAVPFAWSSNNKKIPLVAIKNLKKKLASLVNEFYYQPSGKLDIVAVTGTNGKTSCINFIAQALGDEHRCGLIGTLGIGVYPNIAESTHTTPDVLTIHRALADFVNQNVSDVAIEVSSHGLAQGRIDKVDVDIAIFTNLTQDHLDYHGSMDAYLSEKIKLFKLSSLTTAIINVDDSYGDKIVDETIAENIITYGLGTKNKPDIFASEINYHLDKTDFILNTHQGSVHILSNLIGDFNVNNLLAVCAYLELKNYSLDEIALLVKKIHPVIGRMEKLDVTGYPLVIIDYAHTPDALEHALKSLKRQFKENITCVFGCGGERDQDKREKMGRIAGAYADNIILTNDNPRMEAEAAIVQQIESGITDIKKVVIELDRKKAISLAISNTNKDGCVLIAGKGHEAYQIIGTTKVSFSDTLIAKEFMSH